MKVIVKFQINQSVQEENLLHRYCLHIFKIALSKEEIPMT